MGPKNSGLQLTATQIAASVLAAVTATVAASFLGVNGTIIGAAVASVVSVVGNAVYSHSIHRTRERVGVVSPAMRWMTPATLPAEPPALAARPRVEAGNSDISPSAGRGRWRRAGLAAAGVFVAVLTLLTSVEVVSGRPLSDLLRGTSGSGTTVFGSSQHVGSTVSTPSGTVTVTQTVVPKVVTQTPTITQTAPAVTVTPTPTVTATTSPTSTQPGPTGVPTP
jgi:hypothetical protein